MAVYGFKVTKVAAADYSGREWIAHLYIHSFIHSYSFNEP